MAGVGEYTDALKQVPVNVSDTCTSTVPSTITAGSLIRRILADETGLTAAGFYKRAHTWFAKRGVAVERVLTNNGGCSQPLLV